MLTLPLQGEPEGRGQRAGVTVLSQERILGQEGGKQNQPIHARVPGDPELAESLDVGQGWTLLAVVMPPPHAQREGVAEPHVLAPVLTLRHSCDTPSLEEQRFILALGFSLWLIDIKADRG